MSNKSKYRINDTYEAFDLVMDLAKSKATDLPMEQLTPLLFAVKYLVRAGRKPGTDDLRKAEDYIHMARTGEWSGTETDLDWDSQGAIRTPEVILERTVSGDAHVVLGVYLDDGTVNEHTFKSVTECDDFCRRLLEGAHETH